MLLLRQSFSNQLGMIEKNVSKRYITKLNITHIFKIFTNGKGVNIIYDSNGIVFALTEK